MKIGNINYNIMHSLDSENDTLSEPLKLKKISTKDIMANQGQTTHNINICPDSFKTNFTITSTNEQWLINLSDIDIPEESQNSFAISQQFNL